MQAVVIALKRILVPLLFSAVGAGIFYLLDFSDKVLELLKAREELTVLEVQAQFAEVKAAQDEILRNQEFLKNEVGLKVDAQRMRNFFQPLIKQKLDIDWRIQNPGKGKEGFLTSFSVQLANENERAVIVEAASIKYFYTPFNFNKLKKRDSSLKRLEEDGVIEWKLMKRHNVKRKGYELDSCGCDIPVTEETFEEAADGRHVLGIIPAGLKSSLVEYFYVPVKKVALCKIESVIFYSFKNENGTRRNSVSKQDRMISLLMK